jgi:hypothetical protein
MANTARHASARHCAVRIVQNGALGVVVADDRLHVADRSAAIVRAREAGLGHANGPYGN